MSDDVIAYQLGELAEMQAAVKSKETMIDRDRLREALAALFKIKRDQDDEDWDAQEVDPTSLYVLIEAARLVASETTLIVEKVNGEWPLEVMDKLNKWGAVWVDAYTASELLDALLAQQTGDTR